MTIETITICDVFSVRQYYNICFWLSIAHNILRSCKTTLPISHIHGFYSKVVWAHPLSTLHGTLRRYHWEQSCQERKWVQVLEQLIWRIVAVLSFMCNNKCFCAYWPGWAPWQCPARICLGWAARAWPACGPGGLFSLSRKRRLCDSSVLHQGETHAGSVHGLPRYVGLLM